ncbi:MAG: PIG-L family deacetylase [Cyclobacteriaceae bacterium]|nr:PIG-L family deacetylase [Cyclobacteriaceae bacterium]
MERRSFFKHGMLFGLAPASVSQVEQGDALENDEVIIEHIRKDKPHVGKVLAVIQPHCDDVPIFAGGTVAKLIREGYTGYMIRTTNDDHAGRGNTIGEVVINNERDTEEVAKVLGLKKVYHLNYTNHRMDNVNLQELKARFIFLFRMLKVDTVVSYDPWGHYEENPDHYMTARAVEAAAWMAGGGRDYPEHFDAGLSPHGVKEKYYFARGPQLVNRIVDISGTIEDKVRANRANVTQGPAGEAGASLRKKLAGENKYLKILGNNDEEANLSYIKNFVLDIDSERLRGVPSDKEVGKAYGLEWAERFHYIGPKESMTDRYVEENALRK